MRKAFARISLRARLMIIGISGVIGALLIGALALSGGLSFALNRSLDRQAASVAADVVALVEQDQLPNPIPVAGAQLVQVVDAQQRVVAASLTADRLTPLLRPEELRRALDGHPLLIDGVRAGLAEPLRVQAVRAGTAGYVVIVGQPIGDVVAAVRTLGTALLITFPLLLLVLAGIAWRVIGWTLRPVEELRVGAERIGAGPEQPERLPLPIAADEIRALAVTLNGMLDRLAAARARQRSFVADAAHELRSPLASMRTQLEVAQQLGEGGELPGELLLDLQRLTGLVEDLLLLARSGEDARTPPDLVEVDVRGLLADLAEAQREARVPVRVRDGPAPTVMADPVEIGRALANLVGNAVRHAATCVELAAWTDAGDVVLAVSDDGPGIAPADRERVFERFTRLDDARARDSGGSGLGLAIVRELVGRAGGTVRFVDADPPFVLRAEIRLPKR